MHSTWFIASPSSFLTSVGRMPANVPILYIIFFIPDEIYSFTTWSHIEADD